MAHSVTAQPHPSSFADARGIAAGFAARKDADDRDGCAFDIAVGEGRMAEAVRITVGLAARFPNASMTSGDLGDDYATAGAFDKAIQWLERAYDEGDFVLFAFPNDKAISPAFFQTARWKALADRPRFRQWRAAHDALAAAHLDR